MKTSGALVYEKDGQEVHRMGHRIHLSPEECRHPERILRYFSWAALHILTGKRIESSSGKANKTLAHLSSLKEFNGYEETCRRAVVAKLFMALLVDYPKDDSSWGRFTHTHWHLIWAFAKEYGKDKNWLTQVNFHRVCAIVFGKQYQCLLWWRLVLGKLVRSSRRFIKRELFWSGCEDLPAEDPKGVLYPLGSTPSRCSAFIRRFQC